MLKHWQNLQDWNKHISASPDGGLLQSWQWGKFQESLGNAVFNISDEAETWFAQAIQLKAGNQWILSIPRGPVFKSTPAKEAWLSFVASIKQLATERKCFLVRFDPPFSHQVIRSLVISHQSLVKSNRERNPVHTLIINTSPAEDVLLENMKSKHRYNIRVAEKKGITIEWSNKPDDAKRFYDLVKQTTGRQGFGAYDQEYYRSLMTTLGASDNAKFVFANYKDQTIAGLLIAFFGKRAYYLHGASDYKHRALMAPHLLQWEAIKQAKQRGMDYDLWGVASDPPANKQEKAWEGITRFKKGFAPTAEITEYVGTCEIPVKKIWYWLYRLRQKI